MPKYEEYDETTSLKATDLLLTAVDSGGATYATKRIQAANVGVVTALLNSAPTPVTAGVRGRIGFYRGYDYTWLEAETESITTGSFVTGRAYTITNVGDTDFVAIGASANTLGVMFVATGAGGGTTGTANRHNVIRHAVETVWS